jgi:hypothetical protein
LPQGLDLLFDASVAVNSEAADMFEISDGTVRCYDRIVLKSDSPPPCFDGRLKLLFDDEARSQKASGSNAKRHVDS